MLDQPKMIAIYGAELQVAPVYSKFGVITARQADSKEKVITITSSGKETEKVSNVGDYIVTNSTGAKEQYIISSDKFNKRYEYVSPGKYKAIGKCRAIVYSGESFKFIASWGEEMVCNNGDMLVTSSEGEITEVYRIDIKEFHETYKL